MKQNRTTLRAIDILTLLAEAPKGLSFKDIYTTLDMPKTSAFDILQTLVSTSMVEENLETEKRYKVGLRAFQIGTSYAPNKNLIQVATPHLEELAEKVNKTAILAMFDQGKVIFIHKYDPPSSTVLSTCTIGTSKELYCSSLGKAVLSALSPDQSDRLIDTIVFEKKTDFTITNKSDLQREIEISRERGFAIDDREFEDHVFCMGVPIFNYAHQVVGAISISGLYRGSTPVEAEVLALKHAGTQISQKLGFI